MAGVAHDVGDEPGYFAGLAFGCSVADQDAH
jgi:hypothetical protein